MEPLPFQQGFRKHYKMIVRVEGEYVKGKWENGGEQEQDLMASIQPLSGSEMDRLVSMMQGRHISSAVKIYTDQRLEVGGENTKNGAIVLFEGERYEVISRATYHSGVLEHHKYIARKVN
ncbi:hypothetical protein [Rodentibacter caecimuris]|uniref:hypothetical protein n=1 Tax=Rodentibacter caecimuris TaxID=1796644 RepID=UPI00211A0571|nr:hypothetical protein [Rodentibacter heylii]MCQ9124358.1 hypothetical protein [Rodentibacter heylii]